MRDEGLVLTEIAPGVDLQEHVLGVMGFAPTIASDLKLMDPHIFHDRPMGLFMNIEQA
jgi:propionate CoA-transferase